MLTLLLSSLACFRLTRLVTDDHITDWFRALVVRSVPREAKKKTRQGISCPFCVSFYFALSIAIYLVLIRELDWQGACLWMPAIWGGSVLLNQLFVFLSPGH